MATIRKMFGFIDLTKGSPLKVLILFSIPLFLTLLITNSLNIVNALVLKQTVGGDSVTAINQTNSLNAILLNFGLGTCSGFSVIGGHYFGKKDRDNTIKAFHNSFYLSFIIGVFSSIIGFIVLRPSLELLNVDVRYFQLAYEYYMFIIAGFSIIILNQLAMAFLRAMGNSFFPLIVSVIMMLIQIVLIYFLTSGHFASLDTMGCGIAVVTINLIGLLINYVYLIRKYPYLKINLLKFRYDKVMGKELLRQGLPLGAQWSVLFVGSFVLIRQLNLFGPEAGMAITVFTHMEAYSSIFFATIATSLLSFVSQNYGAGQVGRIKQGIKWSLIMVVICYLIVFVIGYALIPIASDIFLPSHSITANVRFYASVNLYILYPTAIFCALATVFRAILQGIKRPWIPLVSGFGELIMRIVIALVVPLLLDSNYQLTKSPEAFIGISFSNFGAWLIASIIMGTPVVLIFVFKQPLFKTKLQPELAISLK